MASGVVLSQNLRSSQAPNGAISSQRSRAGTERSSRQVRVSEETDALPS